MSTLLNNYTKALENCKCGCIRSKKQAYYTITNDVWEANQQIIQETRKAYTSAEQDSLLKQALYSKLKECDLQSQSSHVKLKFELLFQVGEFGDEAKSFSLCESCYVIFNDHICYRTWKQWKASIKKSILVAGFAAEASAAFSKKCIEKGAKKARYQNIAEARKDLEPLGYTDVEFFQWACIPDTAASREAYLWLSNFFKLVGDYTPNRAGKVQIPAIYTFESIHRMYQTHINTLYTANEHQPLEIRAFQQLWKNVFPNVSISRYCQVSGKCYGCHALYERQEIFTCESDLESIRKLASIHKIMIEMQRGAYIRNRELAQERPDLYMSLIIDGMSQDHCILPYYAGKHTEPGAVVKQKIIGAKQHGIARTFYRLYPHVKGGANVACEVLLHEIERRIDHCVANNLTFPRWLFLQIDGGPENTSKVFYALNEYLVKTGIFERIEVARLPVGHTHEDIDAMFGVLWRAAQGKTIVSPQQWKKMALAAFMQD